MRGADLQQIAPFFDNPAWISFLSNPLTNDLTDMKYTFQMPLTGYISIEGSEEDLNSFFTLARIAFADAFIYNRKYVNCRSWSEHLWEAMECLPDPSPYTDPDLDLPF